jgi:hypothetical protein
MMLKQICLEFLRYRWFPALPLMMGLILAADHFLPITPGATGISVVGWRVVAVAFTGNFLGIYIQPYLTKAFSPLVPGFWNAHTGFVLSLNAILALIVTMAGATPGSPWTSTSVVSVFAVLWCLGSFWLCIGCILRAMLKNRKFWELWGLFLPVWMLWPMANIPVAYDTPALTVVALLFGVALNVVLADALTRRETDTDRTPFGLTASWVLPERLARWLRKRTLAALDTIRHPVRGDFLSQVRLFRLKLQLPHTILAGMLLAALCGVRYLAGREYLEPSDRLVLLMLYFAMIPLLLSGLPGSREDFGRLSLLPLRRQDLVARFGTAALTVSIEVWLTFAAAAFLGALLPVGIGLKSFPSAGFLASSFTTHLALFGISALVSSLQIRLGAQVILALALLTFLAGAAWFTPSPFFSLVATAFAAALLWASYQVLCHSEIA